MEKCFLSIIIPVYNAETHICETLDSCLIQNLNPSTYEILCINDGSTDRSLSILEEYAKNHKNISIYTQTNSGVSAARNKGIQLARGEYIWFIDSDDLIAHHCLKQLSSAAHEHNPDILNFETKAVNHREIFQATDPFYFEVCQDEFKKLYFLTYDDTRWMQEVWRYWFKRKLLLDNKIFFNTNISFGEDTTFSFTATMYAQKCIRTNKSLYQYYRYNDSATAKINTEKRLIYMDSLIQNAKYLKEITKNKSEYWKKIANIKSNYYTHAVTCKLVKEGNVALAKEKIQKMKDFKIYPHPFLWGILKNKSFAQTLLSFFRIFLKFEWYLIFLVRCVSLKRKIFKK